MGVRFASLDDQLSREGCIAELNGGRIKFAANLKRHGERSDVRKQPAALITPIAVRPIERNALTGLIKPACKLLSAHNPLDSRPACADLAHRITPPPLCRRSPAAA